LRTFAVKINQGGGKPPHSKAVTARGQKIMLPAGNFTRVNVLAAADGDQKATFRVGDRRHNVTVQDTTRFIGQWDNRTFNRKEETLPPRPDAPPGAPPRKRTTYEFTGLTPGFIKRAPVAQYRRNESYAYSYVFEYSFDLPRNVGTLTLPNNDKIHIVGINVSNEPARVWPAQPLYDTLDR
jgi:alpha-mannosidase